MDPVLVQCLLNRGLADADSITSFLNPRLSRLADPFTVPNMGGAVDRLFRAHDHREEVVIFGDYDVDGVTATALLVEVLRKLGWKVEYYLPHRMEEGYGLSQAAVETCLARFPVRVLMAVDCGSTSVETIGVLRQRGIDVIVLDHHQLSSPAPPALALVNPQAAVSAGTPAAGSSASPFLELCSVGLAFKLAHALVKRGREAGLPGAEDLDLRDWLDLVALGTIADIVPLTGESRILAAKGLERLNREPRPGVVALKQAAHGPPILRAREVGFQLAPRLNAAGRLETADEALRLLLCSDREEAVRLAQSLDARNLERQRIEKELLDEVTRAVRSTLRPDDDFVIVEGRPSWHVGVVGIVASRLVQQFHRPAIVLGGDGEALRGSGRSITGFDLAAALRECADLLVRQGGHAMAAGLSVMPAKLEAFRERLNSVAHRSLMPEDLQPLLRLDAEVTLSQLTVAALSQLAQLEPLGQGNPPVQLASRNLQHARPLRRMGPERQHVKMWLSDGAATCEAVWWGAGNEPLPVGQFDAAFAPGLNEYRGVLSVQLKLLDWRPAGSPVLL
jgi:single-stranded-DNA-specific exonuclease